LKNTLHSYNFQGVINTKQSCTYKSQSINTHCSWWRNPKVGSNILYICLKMAEQWLKAKMENDLKYITFPYSQSTYIPNFVFPDSFIHSFTQHGNRVTA